MNPGYMSFLLLIMVMILYASGWKEQIFRNTSSKFALFFLTSWWVTIPFQIPLTEKLQVHLQFVILMMISIGILWPLKKPFEIAHVLTSALLLGALYVLFQQIYEIEPALARLESYFFSSLILGLVVFISAREPLLQITVITIGLTLGEFFYVYLREGHWPAVFVKYAWYDQWWLILIFSRLVSEGVLFVCNICYDDKHEIGRGEQHDKTCHRHRRPPECREIDDF